MVRYALWAGDDASSNPAYLINVRDNGVCIIINHQRSQPFTTKSTVVD